MARHPLHVSSYEICGKPLGNGRDVPDLDEREWKRWLHENGELFLARLPFWKKMRDAIGDEPAAEMLKRGRNETEIWLIFREWRDGPERVP